MYSRGGNEDQEYYSTGMAKPEAKSIGHRRLKKHAEYWYKFWICLLNKSILWWDQVEVYYNNFVYSNCNYNN